MTTPWWVWLVVVAVPLIGAAGYLMGRRRG